MIVMSKFLNRKIITTNISIGRIPIIANPKYHPVNVTNLTNIVDDE